MVWFGFAVITSTMGLFMVLERLYPATPLPQRPGWWQRVLAINAFQLAAVIVGFMTWEQLLAGYSLLKLGLYTTPFTGGLLAYIASTWMFYFWHKARHDIYWLWLLCHQVHHSPARLEAITSFYKHPIEIVLDSLFMSLLLYPVLGLARESSIWLSWFSAMGEMIYHANLSTPRWIGFLFQRPESHRVHHEHRRRLCAKNFSDLPLWDILGDTFYNPEVDHFTVTGFEPGEETKLSEMLLLQDVCQEKTANCAARDSQPDCSHYITRVLAAVLVMIGSLQSVGYILNMPTLKLIGHATMASPLPLVFSAYEGVETFSSRHNLSLMYNETGPGSATTVPVDIHQFYRSIGGCYNRVNAYQILFTHGPFFKDKRWQDIRNRVFDYALCDPVVRKFDFLRGRLVGFDLTTQAVSVSGGVKTVNEAFRCINKI
jgi:sterol desaturase/sphingolipid hydroxylase (fatty acid hydroxylase superfamily)